MKQEYITIISKRIKKKIRTEGSPHAMIGAVFFNDSRGSYQALSWRPAPTLLYKIAKWKTVGLICETKIQYCRKKNTDRLELFCG